MTKSYRAVLRIGVALLIAFGAATSPLSHATAGDDDGVCCAVFNEGGGDNGYPPVIFGLRASGIAASSSITSGSSD